MSGVGDLLDRRALLRRAGGAALLGSGVATLAGCGDFSPKPGREAQAVAARSIGLDVASYYPPITDLRRLVQARAQARGANVLLSADAAGSTAQLANLRQWTAARSGFHALVIAPFDAAAVDPLAAAALARGVAVVSYAAPLKHQSAAVGIDPARSGRLLARDVNGWATHQPAGLVQVLLVRPTPGGAAPDPYVQVAPRAETALRGALATSLLQPVAATTATAAADATAAVARALSDFPAIRVVLCWNDTTALGAAAALTAHHPASEHARLYVGGQGAPALSGRASLDALAGNGVLRCLVAPRLRDLADALVDVPFGLLHDQHRSDVPAPLLALTRQSPQLADYRGDYRAA